MSFASTVCGVSIPDRREYDKMVRTIFSKATGAALLTACALFTFQASDVLAQARPAARTPKALLRIKDMSKPSKQALVSSPDIDGKVKSPGHISRGQNWKWAMLEVRYETAAEWTDELVFNFHVMCQDKAGEYHYFQTSVTYIDVANGEHVAAAMLPPNAVVRYGEPINFGVEILVAGETVATQSTGKVPGEWWTKALDVLGDRAKRHGGYLLDRSKTPFGVTHIDEYEATR